MTAPIAYGIDFGTTNSSLAIAYEDGKVKLLTIYPRAPLPACLPSVVYLHRSGDTSAGREAQDRFARTGNQRTSCNHCELVLKTPHGPYSDCKQYSSGSGCLDSRIISELKTTLTSDMSTTHSWARDYELPDLISILLKYLKDRATSSHPGYDVDKVVLGHPITFFGASGPEADILNDRALDRLYDGAHRAGFREIEFYPEPNAAVLDERLEEGITVAVDFGGGTFDTIVVGIQNGEGEVLSSQATAIGGTDFDGLIFDHKLASHLGLNDKLGSRKLPVPRPFIEGLRSPGAFSQLLTGKLLNDSEILGVVTDLKRANPALGGTVDEIIFGGQAPRFFSAIENAKIDLSYNDHTLIEYYSLYSNEHSFSVPLQRKEFNQWIAPYLEEIKATIMRAMDDAEVVPDQVNTVIRTGGSSSIPAFVEMLDQIFGADIIRSRDAFLSVAYGLGVYAQEIWS